MDVRQERGLIITTTNKIEKISYGGKYSEPFIKENVIKGMKLTTTLPTLSFHCYPV